MKTMRFSAAVAAIAIGGVLGGVPGGTSEGNIKEATPWLHKALATAKSNFVCVEKILSVDEQVVSGMHYTFHVLACPVADRAYSTKDCAASHCASDAASPYTIDLYATPWTGAVDLKSIDAEVSTGGWGDGNIADASADLYAAMSRSSSYADSSIPRVCATDILRVRQQVVAGMNYKFDVEGCEVSTALEASIGCTCDTSVAYAISLFAQSWSQTYNVTSVTRETRLVGGWSLHTNILDEDKARFVAAMDADTSNPARVCAIGFLSLQSQVVAGTNYRYHVDGCVAAAGVVVANGCDCTANAAKKFEVTIFEPLGADATPSLTSVVDLARVSLGMQSHRSVRQSAANLGLLAVLMSGVVVVSLVLVQKLRRSQYEKLNVQDLSL
ncbi:Aste57867_14918 [Aphanomyces stellatus]|uniref:Aste57867_14918 protein n=1 Tax=Aphanomyces stellatus TaxID=120398 RepID=A0A485L265_9STRA|nr:hypothetical protein As57867_014862 [Aphanomyces stellatus]VFT91733.1 Aste57867_14918 [Aphanomyces stellatus]